MCDSNYEKWSSTVLRGGAVFPVGKYAEIAVYYEHQNNTGIKPNQQINALGCILSLHFWARKTQP